MDLNQYKLLMNTFRESGYHFSKFHDFEARKSLIVRHDVDFCLTAALKLALLEHEEKIQSTFFFMLTNNFYNILSKEGRRLVMEVKKLGHDISLHFDPTVYENPDSGFLLEKKVFEDAFGMPIDFVSIHRPGPLFKTGDHKLPGVGHTYEKSFFCRIKYVSDSNGEFRHGYPLDLEAFKKGETIHILLHPIWWCYEGETPSDKLRKWQGRNFGFINDEVGANCKAFDGGMAR